MPFGDKSLSRQKHTDQAEGTYITGAGQTDYSKTLYQIRQKRLVKTRQLSNHLVKQAEEFKNLHPRDQHLQEQTVSKHLVDLQAIITDAKTYSPKGSDMIESAETMAKEILEAYPTLNSFVHQGYTANLADIADKIGDEKAIASPSLPQDRSSEFDLKSVPLTSNEEIRDKASFSSISTEKYNNKQKLLNRRLLKKKISL